MLRIRMGVSTNLVILVAREYRRRPRGVAPPPLQHLAEYSTLRLIFEARKKHKMDQKEKGRRKNNSKMKFATAET